MSLQGTEHPCGIATSESTSAARTCCGERGSGQSREGLWGQCLLILNSVSGNLPGCVPLPFQIRSPNFNTMCLQCQ